MGNNPDTNALSMNGAQYCSIENVTITGNFDKGIVDLPGAGGLVGNVIINGGKIGILQKDYRPNPTLVGIVLRNQSLYGMKIIGSRGPVTIAGFEIYSQNDPSPDYRAIYLRNDDSNTDNVNSQADLNLKGGSIYVKGTGGIAIENWNQNVVMSNVFVRADTIIKSGFANGGVESVNGNNTLYKKIPLYAFASGSDLGYVHVAGVEKANRSTDFQGYRDLVTADPPENMSSWHVWGDDMPSWEDPNILNITDVRGVYHS